MASNGKCNHKASIHPLKEIPHTQWVASALEAGLPDGIFPNKHLGKFLDGLAMYVICWNIIWPFGLLYIRLFGIVLGHLEYLHNGSLVYLFPFWYVVRRKIWQPCLEVGGGKTRDKKWEKMRVENNKKIKRGEPPFFQSDLFGRHAFWRGGRIKGRLF
jgi:hypothetical protein